MPPTAPEGEFVRRHEEAAARRASYRNCLRGLPGHPEPDQLRSCTDQPAPVSCVYEQGFGGSQTTATNAVSCCRQARQLCCSKRCRAAVPLPLPPSLLLLLPLLSCLDRREDSRAAKWIQMI